jgi:hypothetical protein
MIKNVPRSREKKQEHTSRTVVEKETSPLA